MYEAYIKLMQLVCKALVIYIGNYVNCLYKSNRTLLTDIWLVVRVPVLSEQMTDVQPKVSTEGRDLTMAFFLAIRLVPGDKNIINKLVIWNAISVIKAAI